MALFKVTTRRRALVSGMVAEAGMKVEIATLSPVNPVTNMQTAEQLNTIFKNQYGIDLKKMGLMNTGYLNVEKIK